MGGNGKRIRSQALIDPQTGSGVGDWSRACELVRDMEAPTPAIAPISRTTIADAIEHFLKLKTGSDQHAVPGRLRSRQRLATQDAAKVIKEMAEALRDGSQQLFFKLPDRHILFGNPPPAGVRTGGRRGTYARTVIFSGSFLVSLLDALLVDLAESALVEQAPHRQTGRIIARPRDV